MENELKGTVYSKNVIEFVTVASEYCAFVENAVNVKKFEFIDKNLKLLSLLYLKTLVLPKVEQIHEEGNEKFVTEVDWQYVKNGIEIILGNDDVYLDFFDDDMKELPEPSTHSISENFADIYQDLKDFLNIYQLGIDDLMNDAIYECCQSFKQYWGFKIVNSLRMLHRIYLSIANVNYSETANIKPNKKPYTNNRFINKAQKDYQSND
jgi:hypothetical protein